MNRTTRWALALAAVISMRAATTRADDAKPSPAHAMLRMICQRIDANHNRRLEIDEVAAELKQLGTALDSDGDRVVSLDELRSAVEMARPMIENVVAKEREARATKRRERIAEVLGQSVPLDAVETIVASIDADGDQEITVGEGLAALRTGAAQLEQLIKARVEDACRDLRERKCPLHD